MPKIGHMGLHDETGASFVSSTSSAPTYYEERGILLEFDNFEDTFGAFEPQDLPVEHPAYFVSNQAGKHLEELQILMEEHGPQGADVFAARYKLGISD